MREEVREQLGRLVTEHGHDLAVDTRRCEAMLRDLCPEDRAEVAVLVAAAEEGVPGQLLEMGGPVDLVLARLSNQLVGTRGLSRDAATWSVAAWAGALGIEVTQQTRDVSDEETDRIRSEDALAIWRRRVPALLAVPALLLFALLGVTILGPDGEANPEPVTGDNGDDGDDDAGQGDGVDESDDDAGEGDDVDESDDDAAEGDDGEIDTSTWQSVVSDDGVVEFALPHDWDGRSDAHAVEASPDLDAWADEYDGTDRDVATVIGFHAEVLSIEELGITAATEDAVRGLLDPEPVPSNCSFEGVSPVVLGDFRGSVEEHRCEGGVHRVGAVFAAGHEDYVLTYRSFETPDTAALVDAVRGTMVIHYGTDVILIDRLWRGFNRAWEAGRQVASEYMAANIYPRLGYTAADCLRMYEAVDEWREGAGLAGYWQHHVLDRRSLVRRDDWEMPISHLAGTSPQGRVYQMEMWLSAPATDSDEPTEREATMHATILDGRAHFFFMCEQEQ